MSLAPSGSSDAALLSQRGDGLPVGLVHDPAARAIVGVLHTDQGRRGVVRVIRLVNQPSHLVEGKRAVRRVTGRPSDRLRRSAPGLVIQM